MPTRRNVLAGLTAATLSPALGWSAVGNPVAISAGRAPDGRYILVGLNAEGDITFNIPLPARGHAAAADPILAEVVAIARRPGTFAKVIDCASGLVRQTLHAPEGRHFYGHGAFSADGRWLFTTENDVDTGSGRIGVWDRGQNYQRVDNFASGGIGPHEILRLPSGQLAIANGGIRTHPNTGREKLNLDTMRPNLSIFSPQGVLQDQADVPATLHQNSLRHIAVQADGTIACGLQWQGDPFDAPSLIALYRGAGQLYFAEMDEDVLRGLDGYIGSVSALGSQGFAATSPRGNQVMVFDFKGELSKRHRATDVCGIAALRDHRCLVTDGTGKAYLLDGDTLRAVQQHGIAFDNHLVAVQS